jgi:hypothetical protein
VVGCFLGFCKVDERRERSCATRRYARTSSLIQHALPNRQNPPFGVWVSVRPAPILTVLGRRIHQVV